MVGYRAFSHRVSTYIPGSRKRSAQIYLCGMISCSIFPLGRVSDISLQRLPMWLCIQMPQGQFDLEDGATTTGSMGYGQVLFLENKETAVLKFFPIQAGLKLWEHCFSAKVVNIYTSDKAIVPDVERLYYKDPEKVAYVKTNRPFIHAKQHTCTSHPRAYKRGRKHQGRFATQKQNSAFQRNLPFYVT